LADSHQACDARGVPGSFRSDRSWSFDIGASELWGLITQTDRYASWWPWLRAFDAPSSFSKGARWQCAVAPPLPYVVRFTIHITELVPRERVRTRISGDISGTARLELDEPSDGTTSARLISELAPSSRPLRAFGRVAPPLVRWGHDWVLDQGRLQFVRRVATEMRDAEVPPPD
jgi:hypothetical protein